jgi:hypothetical protein
LVGLPTKKKKNIRKKQKKKNCGKILREDYAIVE